MSDAGILPAAVPVWSHDGRKVTAEGIGYLAKAARVV